ncbi:helix-turn-helix transcriptional regulator [Roseivivax sediminis]|uniref:Transcriptional regulator /transcriptional regulator, LuxR family n=1 Tax=Roseivivax sediminis TaxID=936889 RepID=A0A1I1V6W0_9RHOB|nr:LuxR C-terminal-related transcriptional regulator [Roseivivax sediminis]SFD78565.1 transcriptional regulator /transcriptional regulator, LuxR family [Roseivivax sediminis]
MPRARLVSEMLAARAPRLTVVTAPAGFGKTSFAGQWFRGLREQCRTAAWLSLDTEHRDAPHLLQHVIAALDQAMAAERRPGDLDTLSLPALLQVLRGVAGGLADDLTLFLDDYHLAQSDPAEAAVFKLCSEAAFARLRVVLISRGRPNFPLARLRLDREVRQIGVERLLFSVEETQALFGSSTRDTDWIAALAQRTEGWPMAVHMARVLSDEAQAAQDIWHGFATSDGDMGRYLIEQVISALPANVCDFLYATAALPAVSADLAAAVTEDPAARETFRTLADHGLPISVTDSGGQWIRYHPLLSGLLKEEAQRRGREPAGALTRAAAWFRDRGEIKTAVRHALLAGDAALAARMTEAEGGWRLIYLTARGGMSVFRQLSEHVAGIPLDRFPLTTLGLAVLFAKLGQLQAARHYLGLVTRTEAGDAGVERQGRLVHALLSLYDDSHLGPEELTGLEHDLATDRELGMVHRGLLLNLLSFNYLNQGRLQQSVAYGEQSVRCLKDCGAEFGALHLHIHIGQAQYLSGDPRSAQGSYARLIADARTHLGAGSDLEAIGQVLQSELDVQRGEIAGVTDRLGPALAHVADHDVWFDILAAGLTTQLRMALIEGRFADGHAAIDEARGAARRRGLHRLRALCDSERVRLMISEGELAEAQRLASLSGLGADRAHSRADNLLSTQLRGAVPALLWVRIWLARGAPERAADTLSTLTAMQAERLSTTRFVELQVLAIRIAVARGEPGAAAERLLELAYRAPLAEYRGSVLEEGPEVLDTFRTLAAQDGVPESARTRIAEIAPPTGHAVAADALTPREREIVALLSEGRTNKQIGLDLEMSENTVKFHLRNLFGKLEVTTRTAAVTAARGRGLID